MTAPLGIDPDAPPTETTAPPDTDPNAPSPAESVIIPYLISTNEPAAVEQLSAAGLAVRVSEQRVEDPERDSIVIDQIPAPGIPVEPGSEVTLVVTRFVEPEGAP